VDLLIDPYPVAARQQQAVIELEGQHVEEAHPTDAPYLAPYPLHQPILPSRSLMTPTRFRLLASQA